MADAIDEVLADALRTRPGLSVTPLSGRDCHRPGLLPTFLQDGHDVHGGHGLFYWLRARQRGLVVRSGNAAVILAWRSDVRRLAALRPVGTASAAASLLDTVAMVASTALPGIPLLARYCGDQLTATLLAQRWHPFGQAWCPEAPLDDEAFPEVVITTDLAGLPLGRKYKSLREAVTWHQDAYQYRASPDPLGGEAQAITGDTEPARPARAQEADFDAAVVAALGAGCHQGLAYHYLHRGTELAGWAVTGNTTGTSHGYYLWTARVPRLATYFLWQIYQRERCSGATALNLGGSETQSLHHYKTRTFPDHALQKSSILCPPAQP
jgi:hypothetical protein